MPLLLQAKKQNRFCYFSVLTFRSKIGPKIIAGIAVAVILVAIVIVAVAVGIATQAGSPKAFAKTCDGDGFEPVEYAVVDQGVSDLFCSSKWSLKISNLNFNVRIMDS